MENYKFITGGILGYLTRKDYVHNYNDNNVPPVVVDYNKRTGVVIYQCPKCGGTGVIPVEDISWNEERQCPACYGNRHLSLTLDKETKEFIDNEYKLLVNREKI